MSRPVLLVCVLVILIITSQFEWRQQLVSDVDAIATPRESQKQQRIQQREENIKEKVIVIADLMSSFAKNHPNQSC